MAYVLTRIIITAFSIILVAEILPGISVDSLWTALIAAVVFGIFNVIVRPVLVLMTLPITLLTLGLFIFVINAFLFWMTASFIDGFAVEGFFPALIGSLIVSAVSTLLNRRVDT